ncbi:DUF2637 domain-containing protein [Nocardiopsis aegyptia]|uniref:DUF2637 domain-containing protein n=1 Tax=Nocardiopsis aegyptia TaxID=220378 RepID=A0A7Z0ER58_9ACTN|nr:DUF2637 domain-containing protein [Nocardiopsis aegyptia]NYJ35830.1 hypothetical protein [Nocardiopsis aegyptia]
MAMAPYNNAPETGTRNSRPAGRGSGAGALVGGALFVGVIAVCALVISYHGIFQFARYGGHEGSPLAHVFPATYALLVLMAFWVSYMLREARPRQRLWVDVILIPALVLLAAGAMLLNNFELVESVNQRVANVIVAVAPLAALLIAFLLWLTVRAHIRRRRRAPSRPRPAEDRTTVLPARAVAPPEDEFDEDEDEGDDPLSTRLLRLGAADDTVIRPSPAARPAAPEEDDAPPVGRLHAQPVAPADDVPEEDDAETASEAPGPEEPEAPEARGPEEPEASVPTVPLPRRASRGDNPIKRAAETVPVVPGAARPAPVEDDDEPAVADDLADEGFLHEPPPGDPTTDEAEAPPAVPEPPAVEEAQAPEPGPAPMLLAQDDEDEEPTAPLTGPAMPGEERFQPGAADPDEPEDLGVRDEHRESAPSSPPEAQVEPHTSADDPVDEAESDEPAPHLDPAVVVDATPAGSSTTVEPAPYLDPTTDEDVSPTEPPASDVDATPTEPRIPDEPAPYLDPTADEDGTAVESPTTDEPSPGGDLWEPPREEPDTSALDDYVPPVWTPPGEDPEESHESGGPDRTDAAAEREEQAFAPALDHDTGPEVRAAFRIGPPSAPEASGAVPPAPPRPSVEPRAPRTPRFSGTVPPGAARPGPEPEPEPAVPEDTAPDRGPRPEAPRTPEPEPMAERDPEATPDRGRTAEQNAEQGPEPEPESSTDPEPERRSQPPPHAEPERPVLRKRPLRTPVEKRAMAFKPPRPPMPDFTAEPPSRRVRSEPLRPEE